MSVLEKHLEGDSDVEINGEKIPLASLDIEDLPTIFKAIKTFSGVMDEKADMSEVFKNMDAESLEAVKELIKKTLKNSFPEETPEVKSKFGLKYMMVLFPKIMEMNMSLGDTDDNKRKLSHLKDMQKKKLENNAE